MNLKRRLNKTYQKVYRDRHVKAKELALTDQEYRLWDLLLALYDWDRNHQETYGTIEATEAQLAELLNCSDSKVCRVRAKLTKKGLVTMVAESVYQVASLQDDPALMKQQFSEMKQPVADLQEKQSSEDVSSLVSYKDKYRLLRSDEEYEKLHEEFPGLSVDDMKWIDLNV